MELGTFIQPQYARDPEMLRVALYAQVELRAFFDDAKVPQAWREKARWYQYELSGSTSQKMGIAYPRQGLVVLSFKHLEAMRLRGEDWIAQLRDTLRHEIAHVVTWQFFNARGHGPEWKLVALACGSSGDQYHTQPKAPTRKGLAAMRQRP